MNEIKRRKGARLRSTNGDTGQVEASESTAVALDTADIANQHDALRIPVLAEELVVETRLVPRGVLRVRKRVKVAEQSVRVPLYHEEASVDHVAPDDYDAALAGDPDGLFLPIYEEEVVIEKRMVLKEYIHVRKNRVEEMQTVSETVRRAYVEIAEQDGDMVRG